MTKGLQNKSRLQKDSINTCNWHGEGAHLPNPPPTPSPQLRIKFCCSFFKLWPHDLLLCLLCNFKVLFYTLLLLKDIHYMKRGIQITLDPYDHIIEHWEVSRKHFQLSSIYHRSFLKNEYQDYFILQIVASSQIHVYHCVPIHILPKLKQHHQTQRLGSV